jgi:hypothetical protein
LQQPHQSTPRADDQNNPRARRSADSLGCRNRPPPAGGTSVIRKPRFHRVLVGGHHIDQMILGADLSMPLDIRSRNRIALARPNRDITVPNQPVL